MEDAASQVCFKVISTGELLLGAEAPGKQVKPCETTSGSGKGEQRACFSLRKAACCDSPIGA